MVMDQNQHANDVSALNEKQEWCCATLSLLQVRTNCPHGVPHLIMGATFFERQTNWRKFKDSKTLVNGLENKNVQGKNQSWACPVKKKLIKGWYNFTLSMLQSWMINLQRMIRSQRLQTERENVTLISVKTYQYKAKLIMNKSSGKTA